MTGLRPEQTRHFRFPDRMHGEGEACPPSRPVALGPDAPSVGLHDSLAEGTMSEQTASVITQLLPIHSDIVPTVYGVVDLIQQNLMPPR